MRYIRVKVAAMALGSALVLLHAVPATAVVGGTAVNAEKRADELASPVLLETDISYCTATLITARKALTAAHCIVHATTGITSSPSSMTVRKGTQLDTAEKVGVTAVHVHPEYITKNGMMKGIDLAVLILDADLPGIKPVRLVDAHWPYLAGTVATLAGWGSTEDNSQLSTGLRSVELILASHDDCVRSNAQYQITTSMLCAGPLDPEKAQGIGNGDSGGPLLAATPTGPMVIGVVSWSNTVGLVQPGEQSVFTKLGGLIPWINQFQTSAPTGSRPSATVGV